MSAVTAPLRPRRVDEPTQRPDPRRHLRVVEEPRPRHTLRYALLILAVLGAAVFGTVSLNAMAAANAVASHELETQVAEAERTYGQLVADVAELEDPARIRERAEELGMVPAADGRHLRLERTVAGDGAPEPEAVAGESTDPLKPLLSARP